MRTNLQNFVVVGIMIGMVSSSMAAPFSACPTYPLSASETTNRPTAIQYDRLVSDFNWCYRALQDRHVVTHNNLSAPSVTDGVEWIVYDLQWLQQETQGILSGFVDHSAGMNFAGTSSIPMMVTGTLLSRLGIPTTFFDPNYTPFCGLYDDTTEEEPYKNHGAKNLIRIVRELDCTIETRGRSDGTSQSLKRYAQGLVDGYNAPLSITNCINAWPSSTWVTNTDSSIYQFMRNQWHEPTPGTHDIASAQRVRSIPKCSNIPVATNATYQWSAYALPTISTGPSTQTWDTVTFLNGKLLTVSSGSGSATNIVLTDWMYAGETCPWSVQPTSMGSVNCHIDTMKWIFQWQYQFP